MIRTKMIKTLCPVCNENWIYVRVAEDCKEAENRFYTTAVCSNKKCRKKWREIRVK